MVVWLVCDASGSMVEGGKRFIVRGLIRQFEQYFRLGHAPRADLRLVAWQDHAVQLVWETDDEVPAGQLDCKGQADAGDLTRLLGVSVGDRYLILSDGYWTEESRRELKSWRERLSGDALRIVKIGADANPKLTGPDVFEPEDFFAAVDGWLTV